MPTANDICVQCLRKAQVLGVGETAQAEDINDAFSDLNDMLAQWQRNRWLIWSLVDTLLVSTGAQSYTVAAGGDFNIARPDRLEAAYLRQVVSSSPNDIDYPLEIIEARETYSRISMKTLESFPRYIFYDAAYPTGVIYPWPIPAASVYEIHIITKAVLSQFANLATQVALPPEYSAAIKWNLTRRLRVSYGYQPDTEVNALAKDALNVIRKANTQIARLRMPGVLRRPGLYNIYADDTY